MATKVRKIPQIKPFSSKKCYNIFLFRCLQSLFIENNQRIDFR